MLTCEQTAAPYAAEDSFEIKLNRPPCNRGIDETGGVRGDDIQYTREILRLQS